MATLITDRQKRRPARWRMQKSPWKAYVLLVLMLISTVSTVRANGDLKNAGAISNSGKIRVQNQAQGLPAVNGGLYEFFGGNQSIPGRQYVDLKLSGTGTKTSDADATVTGTLTVATGVTYDTGPFTTHLTGTLAEAGYVTGKVDKNVLLTGGSGSSGFGNIGATISWLGVDPGLTLVTRQTGQAQTSASTGNQSIKRYFDITPATNTGLSATLVFKYADSELNGQDATTLTLWRSIDGGATWRSQVGVVNTTQRTITKAGISSFGRWTASDVAHPLGVTTVEGSPTNIAIVMGNGQTSNVGMALPVAFVAKVTDAFGTPIKDVVVSFAIASSPSGATGQSLSVISTGTDALGQASTTLTLGDKPGSYTVSATAPAIAGSLLTFNATAVKSSPVLVATRMAMTSGNNQTAVVATTVTQPYVITVMDQFGAPMPGVVVTFGLAGTPAGATGQKLSQTVVTTDTTGHASTVLTFGTKAGEYVVTASSGSLAGSPVVFTSKAVAGAVANMVLPLGTNLSGQILQTVSPPVLVQVTDAYGNPISGVGVRYLLTSSPTGSTGTSPQDVTVATDSLGRSQISLVLGTKAGAYTFQVSAGTLAPQTITVTATGGQVVAVASRLVQTSGSGQSGVVLTQLADPFVVTVLDQNGNAFAGATVRFAITGSPSGDNAAVLSSSTVATGTNGQASVRLTLGKTVGVYTVTASSDTLSGSPVQFTAVATGSQTGTVASRLVQTSGSGQSGVVTTQLASPLVVTVVDTVGNPVSGVSVHFALGTAPSGSAGQVLSVADASTDANGKAQTVLTLGTKVGQYTVTASSGTLIGSPVTFSATALPGVAARLQYVAGNGQTGTTYSSLVQPFVVRVTDANLNPVSGASVRFAVVESPVSSSRFSLDVAETLTDNLGLASARLTLGDRVGLYMVSAGSPAIIGAEVAFTASATAGSPLTLNLVSGDAQRGLVGSTLRQPFVVAAFDADGNPVPGVGVQFAIESAPAGATGHSISRTTAVTDSSGNASTFLTLGNVTGVYAVAPSSNGLNGGHPVFHAIATLSSGAMGIMYSSGDGQSAGVLSQLSSPLVATVFGADGSPVAGQVVTFAIDSLPSGATGQALSTTSATTDAQGRATTILTLGNKIGTYMVSASVSGLSGSPVIYRLVSTVGLPKTLALVQGSGQTKSIGTTLDNAFVVRVLDVASNPVPGVSVQFTLDTIPSGSSGQSLHVVNSLTDAQGQSQAVLTLGSKVGSYVVTATSSGLSGSPMRFSARATAGPAAVVLLSSGDAQTAPVSTELLSPFVVTVTDGGGNLVTGTAVGFTIETTPSGSRGQALRILNSLTDAQGQASAYLTLGDREGHYTVTATASGLTPIRFSSTATVLVGDLNGDNEVNIADLTTVIDYILGKITLTGSDSIKADFNKDGHIDIRDVVAMQNYLLAITGVSTQVGTGTGTGMPAVSSTVSTAVDTTVLISGEFVLTENGLRYNLTNTVPVKGLQLIIRFKDAQNVVRPDEIFDRAKVDSFYVNSSGRELRIVAYNIGNVPIAAGSGALFRLPVKLSDVSGIEVGQMIVSRTNNTAFFDDAMTKSIAVRLVTSQDLPTTFVLYQNYPNPFNGQTKIDYEVVDVAGMADVSVQVYNVLGEKVKTLITARHAGGRFTVRWDGTDDRGTKLASGTYYYRLISGDFVSSKKMIMLK
jgi:hypothetical protein